MLTKAEYSSSTSSLSTVFSGSFGELTSKMMSTYHTITTKATKDQSGSFKNRLRERISKNKSTIRHLKQVIQVSEKDVLTLHQMRKALYENEAQPLVTFVSQLSNTSDHALLSMHRELAKKDGELELLALTKKLASEESAYLKHYSAQTTLFKKGYFDKEKARYQEQVKHSERLLREGEDLVLSCKQKLEERDRKLKDLTAVIEQREHLLVDKQHELASLQRFMNKDSDSNGKPQVKSFILEAKATNIKHDIKRLQNEKLELESSELDYKREIDGLKIKLGDLTSRNTKEASSVQKIKTRVGSISKTINKDIERLSIVRDSQEKLKQTLKKEEAAKKQFLHQVSLRTQSKTGSLKSHHISRKSVKNIDLSRIDDMLSTKSGESTMSSTKNRLSKRNTLKVSSIAKANLTETTEENESKADESYDNDFERQTNLSILSFDADCEFPQSESRLPIGSQFDISRLYSTQRHGTLKLSDCQQFASPSHKGSRPEVPKISDHVYLSCSKILEENDEYSVSGLTPRLSEDAECEINFEEENGCILYANRDAKGNIDKGMYASKTSLETEETSFSKLDDDSDFGGLERRETENSCH